MNKKTVLFFFTYSIFTFSMDQEDYKKAYPFCWLAVYSDLHSLEYVIRQLERKTTKVCYNLIPGSGNKEKMTPAASSSLKQGVELMMESLIYQPDLAGNTPLSIAIFNDNKPFFDFFMRKITNIDQPIYYDLTPLHFCCLTGNYEFLKTTLHRNAAVNKQTTKGISPLYFLIANIIKSIEKKSVQDWKTELLIKHNMVKLLLSYQADPYKKNKENVNCLDLIIDLQVRLPYLFLDNQKDFLEIQQFVDTIYHCFLTLTIPPY